MDDDNSTTTKSGLNSKPLSQAVDTIGTNLNTAMQSGVDPYAKPLYTGMGANTGGGLYDLHKAANAGAGGLNDAYDWAKGVVGSGGYNPALTSAQSGIQQYLQESQADAPGYAALRAKAGEDTMNDVSSMFTASGRFGSGSHVGKATESLGNVYAGLDYQNYNDRLGRMLGGNQALAGIGQTAMGNAAGAAAAIPGLYGATLTPAQTRVGIGQMQDADALAARQADADLFDRTQNADWNSLARASGIFAGTAPGAGTKSTSSQNVPWWQSAGSLALGGLSLFG